jgi:serine/threonine protein phosphatase PrpC
MTTRQDRTITGEDDEDVARAASGGHPPAGVGERRGQDLCHILTDAVGAAGGYPMVEVDRFRLKHGDCVLLCTKGLTDSVGAWTTSPWYSPSIRFPKRKRCPDET